MFHSSTCILEKNTHESFFVWPSATFFQHYGGSVVARHPCCWWWSSQPFLDFITSFVSSHQECGVPPRVFVETALRFRTGWVSSLGVAAPPPKNSSAPLGLHVFPQKNSGDQIPKLNRLNLPRAHPGGLGFTSHGFSINLSTCTNLGCGPLTVTVTTKIITFLIGNPYKSSFTTVTVRGPHPIPTTFFCISLFGGARWGLNLFQG